jgi:SAM-dependent methyltransferase
MKELTMYGDNAEIIERAEIVARDRPVTEVLRVLRQLCLWDFSLLLLTLPQSELPNLSRALPRMASAEVQKNWTGDAGTALLQTTTDFVRILSFHFHELCHRRLNAARVIDYGCGYGRIIRPMYYFTDPENIYGVEPWAKSLEICREDGVLGHLVPCDYLPDSLPFPEAHFDLIYAYSVFTHTSLKVTQRAISTLRKYVSPSGMLALTVRPLEWWQIDTFRQRPGFDLARQLSEHKLRGFAFLPSDWNRPPDGESIFGDTTIASSWFTQSFPVWSVRSYDRGFDPWQTIVLMTPR